MVTVSAAEKITEKQKGSSVITATYDGTTVVCIVSISIIIQSNCSAEKTETIPVLSHEHNRREWMVERKATCEKSETSVTTCSECGNKEEKDISVTGHNNEKEI